MRARWGRWHTRRSPALREGLKARDSIAWGKRSTAPGNQNENDSGARKEQYPDHGIKSCSIRAHG